MSFYKTLKQGQIFYECFGGKNYEFVVIDEPTFENNQWKWVGENTKTKEKHAFLITKGLECYGPKIYSEPMYAQWIGDKMVTPINE